MEPVGTVRGVHVPVPHLDLTPGRRSASTLRAIELGRNAGLGGEGEDVDAVPFQLVTVVEVHGTCGPFTRREVVAAAQGPALETECRPARRRSRRCGRVPLARPRRALRPCGCERRSRRRAWTRSRPVLCVPGRVLAIDQRLDVRATWMPRSHLASRSGARRGGARRSATRPRRRCRCEPSGTRRRRPAPPSAASPRKRRCRS